ncbi:Transposase, L1 containing protein [Cricetulus griseus]|nr:Transposase, L1 containing protein [Cricetulus griseus]
MKTTESWESGNITVGNNQKPGSFNLACHSPKHSSHFVLFQCIFSTQFSVSLSFSLSFATSSFTLNNDYQTGEQEFLDKHYYNGLKSLESHLTQATCVLDPVRQRRVLNTQRQPSLQPLAQKRTDIRVLDLIASTRREPWSHTHQENKKLLLHPPEERMRRGKGKSTSNNRKPNMTPVETRNHTPVRPEHHDADEPEENDLKNIFMKMIEDLKEDRKEDTRKSLKEIEDKTNQKIQDISKSLKETVQDLKTEIQTIKKAQSEGMLEIEKLGKRSGTTDVSITNRIQEMEERLSGVEDTLAEIDLSTKENLKSNKSLSQNIQEIWDTVKGPKLRIIGIEEGEEIQLKGSENIFNKIIEKKLSQPKERHINENTRSLQNTK